jgi:hypothetical protein
MVDRMRRRVIELSEGHVVRDEQIGRYSTSETTGEFAARLRVETPGVGVEGPEADPTPRRLIPPEEEVG